MIWSQFGCLFLLLVCTSLAQLPEWCEGEVACCIFDRCEDCDCHLCVIAGGQPAGPNSTCRDECVCFDDPPPPVCDNRTFCRVAHARCTAIPECGRCLNETEQDFCSNINRLAALQDQLPEEICETPELLTFFLLYYSTLICPPRCRSFPPSPPLSSTPTCPEPTPCLPPLPCPPDFSSELSLLLLLVTGILACVCGFFLFPRRRRRTHHPNGRGYTVEETSILQN